MEWITSCEYDYSVNLDSECLCYKKVMLITTSLLQNAMREKYNNFYLLLKKKGLNCLFELGFWRGKLQFPASNYRIS